MHPTQKPLEMPSVWRAAELTKRNDWLHELTKTEIQEIGNIIAAFSKYENVSTAEVQIYAPQLTARLLAIQTSLEEGSGATMIRGFSPTGYDVSQLTRFFESLVRLVGTPLSQSATGIRIFSVRNEGFAEGDTRARGPNTKKKLSFHTDRCDVISFLCIAQAKSGGENQLVSSPALYNAILKRRPDLLAVLMEPFYYQRHNVDTGNADPFTRQPIFSLYKGHFAANFLRVLIERAHANPKLPTLSAIQIEALDFLEHVAAEEDMHITFRQQPGDILFMNNWVTLHRRTAFEDFDQADRRRHILRAWLSMPNSRPIDPLFAGNYGATEAGAIRGGMKATSS